MPSDLTPPSTLNGTPYTLNGQTGQFGSQPAQWRNDEKSYLHAESLGVLTSRNNSGTLTSTVKLTIPLATPVAEGCCPTNEKPEQISVLVSLKAPASATITQLQDARLWISRALAANEIEDSIISGKPVQ